MALTPEEKAIIQAEIQAAYVGVGADNVASALNTEVGPDLVTIPLEDGRQNISNLVILSYMTKEQRELFRAARAADADLKELWESDIVKTINDPVFLGMIDTLAVALSIDAETVAKIKRHGQRLRCRAEELIGRKITVAEIREAM